MSKSIPRDGADDYSPEIIEKRQRFIEETTGATLDHTKQFSFDAQEMAGNIENMFGVVQVPIGVAGPLLVNGEHAQGEFYVPMATVEGTMLASYNRGMKVIREAGGVMTTVVGQAMQRAPCFVFRNSRDARDFEQWLVENFPKIKEVAESTTSVGKLDEIEHYCAHNFVYTRFDYSTGDAAGQNMTSRATFVACEWIRENYPALKNYLLSGNFDTEKRTSSVNLLKNRGKRVTAEITIPREVLERNLRITPEAMHYGQGITTIASFLTNSSNNAAHPANGLAALYLATGQDIANIGESNQCTTYNRVTREGDYHFSITLPCVIVASYGGGTNLPTQRECLKMMDCHGQGKALKLAEIAAALVVAGELSLGAATRVDKKTRQNEWVDAHERLGRNR
ncbi:hydroxymethylglutaryl-CoA reductase [Congregibacter litoralis]|uniref:hydroxymethylglutaryl-CoA reductase (NADPH) n=1 Tax=Congregibacter litoralis KT71 TaxID=314285 RepID=A4ACC0_9GAMM|nr:hydroxymethylglutaryl-CoA reductase [Congregibacter litoralis]EAQ96348.1 3-hydroxy-3-methylglutaryl-coenzyme A reductase [Congregibacter litoralis KT71]